MPGAMNPTTTCILTADCAGNKTKKKCLLGECVTRKEYNEAGGGVVEGALGTGVATAEASSTGASYLSEINAAGYLLYKSNSNYVDDQGFYMDAYFSYWPMGDDANDAAILDNLSPGEVGILKETFSDPIYGNAIVQYYTISDYEVTLTTDEDESEYVGWGATRDISYESAEEGAIEERFGSSETAEQILEGIIKTISTDVATTAINAQYTFKKIRYDVLDYDNLTSFDKEEATQSISITTSFVSGAY